jgi:hypothetical protein
MSYPDGGGLTAAERARREQVRFGACLAEPLWDSQARHLDRKTPPALGVPRWLPWIDLRN